MLYVSRSAGERKWGIVDTDDYIETVVSENKLRQLIREADIEIKGVTVYNDPFRGRQLQNVEVFQNPEFSTGKIAKAALLMGVEIRVSGTDIVGIFVRRKLTQPEVRVRLSDYGTSCSTRILREISVFEGQKLVIVLDDKIKIQPNTFKGIGYLERVMLDVTEVNDEKLLHKAYTSDNYAGGYNNIDRYILDRPERTEFWKAVGVLYYGVGPHSVAFKLSDVLQNIDGLSKQLEEHFGKNFKAVMAQTPALKNERSRNFLIYYVNNKVISTVLNADADGTMSWEIARKYVYDFEGILRDNSTLNKLNLHMLTHYLVWFSPSDEIKNLFTKTIVKWAKWVQSNWD